MLERLGPLPCMTKRGCPERHVQHAPDGCPFWVTGTESNAITGEERDISGCYMQVGPLIMASQARRVEALAGEVSGMRRAMAESAALAVERSVMAVAERQERARLGLDG